MNEKELKFKYEIGEIVGVYKILEHWREKNKNNGKSRKSNTRVFYECQCIKCGHILERSRQEYLDSVKNNSSCVNCIHINMDNFRFDIGEKINDRLVIINKFREKGLRIYQYKCEKDGYIGTIPEQNILNTKIKCPVCTHCKLVTGLNDFNTLYPQYARFLINSKDGDNIGVGENAYADFICPHCGRKLTHVNIRTIVRYGYIPCIYCGKGHSNAEKLMSIILMDNGVNFIPQKKFKEWGYNYIYDFYLPDVNYIIELNGRQHYEETNFFSTNLEDQQEIDKHKKEIALQNKINFLEIDCRWKHINDLCKTIIDNISPILQLSSVDINYFVDEFLKHNFTNDKNT